MKNKINVYLRDSSGIKSGNKKKSNLDDDEMEEDVKGKENLICIPVMAKKESRKKKKVVVYSFQLFSTIECMKGKEKILKSYCTTKRELERKYE